MAFPFTGVKTKQCGLDLVFPCITVKMFVSAIVPLLLLVTAALTPPPLFMSPDLQHPHTRVGWVALCHEIRDL